MLKGSFIKMNINLAISYRVNYLKTQKIHVNNLSESVFALIYHG